MVALREGSLLHVEGNALRYFSANGQGFKVFRHGEETREYQDTRALARWCRSTAAESHPAAGGINKIAATTVKRAYNALPTGRYNDQHEIP